MADVIVKCPNCQTTVAWVNPNKSRPFCSERCRLIDLGEWADEKRYIPSDEEHYDVTESDLDQRDSS
jgi:hypothetical protein